MTFPGSCNIGQPVRTRTTCSRSCTQPAPSQLSLEAPEQDVIQSSLPSTSTSQIRELCTERFGGAVVVKFQEEGFAVEVRGLCVPLTVSLCESILKVLQRPVARRQWRRTLLTACWSAGQAHSEGPQLRTRWAAPQVILQLAPSMPRPNPTRLTTPIVIRPWHTSQRTYMLGQQSQSEEVACLEGASAGEQPAQL